MADRKVQQREVSLAAHQQTVLKFASLVDLRATHWDVQVADRMAATRVAWTAAWLVDRTAEHWVVQVAG